MTATRCTDPTCFIRADTQLEATNTMELLEQVRELVDCCLLHGACFFVIDAEIAHRYSQLLIDYRGELTLESVSNESIGEPCSSEHPITDSDHAALLRLGWLPPDEDHPNWYRRVDWKWHYPGPLVAEILVRTLVEVHKASLDELHLTVAHAVSWPPSRANS